MKHEDPLLKIDEVRRRLGAPRVNISVLWTVVVQLASDMRWLQSEVDAQRLTIAALREQLYNGDAPWAQPAATGVGPGSAVDPTQPTLFEE